MTAPPPLEVVRGARDSTAVAFPPSWLGLEVEDTDGNRATAENPETARQVLARLPRVVALLPGPMFDLVEGGTNYAASRGSQLLYRYLDQRRGITAPTRYPSRGATLSVGADGRATVLDGAHEVEGARFALQGYPEVIRNGRLEATDAVNRDNVGRAALCLLSDGRVAFAVGRATMANFGRALLALRFAGGATIRDAIYTDGGGSTALALRGEGGALTIAHGLDARRLPAYIIAEPPPAGVGMVVAGGGDDAGGAPASVVSRARAALRSPVVRGLGGALAITAAGAWLLSWLEERDRRAALEVRAE